MIPVTAPPPEPGYYLNETHGSVSWRSTPDVRPIDDEILALTVMRFQNGDYGLAGPATLARNAKAVMEHDGAVLGYYRIGEQVIQVCQRPERPTPTVRAVQTSCSNT